MSEAGHARSIWDLRPSEIAALGYSRNAAHLFGRIQRVAAWDQDAGRPALARTGREFAESAKLDFSLPSIVDAIPSCDGSARIVLALADGAQIEAVHMPRPHGRVTICLSSQVGCAMGCSFCATATMGLRRHLAAHEIIGQLLAILHRYGPRSSSSSLVNLVFMGMGEPLHNVDALIRALDVICDPAGLGISPSRITVSTAGHVSGLDRLAQHCREHSLHAPELAISVNATLPDLRRRLMPIDRKWSLTDLRAAIDRWPKRPHSKITIEYVLLRDVNDDLASATSLAQWIRPTDLRHIVNVIPFNEWTPSESDPPPFAEPEPAIVDAFVARLRDEGCLVKVRLSRGRDARGACGTLTLRPKFRISEKFDRQQLRTV